MYNNTLWPTWRRLQGTTYMLDGRCWVDRVTAWQTCKRCLTMFQLFKWAVFKQIVSTKNWDAFYKGLLQALYSLFLTSLTCLLRSW